MLNSTKDKKRASIYYKRMNPPITSDLSLYQLTQTTDPHLSPLTVSASRFREWVDTSIQFLIDQQIQATIWAKLPPPFSLVDNLRKLLSRGSCSTHLSLSY